MVASLSSCDFFHARWYFENELSTVWFYWWSCFRALGLSDRPNSMAGLIARNIEMVHGTKRSLLRLGMMWPVTQSCFVWYFFYCSVVLVGTICVLSLAIVDHCEPIHGHNYIHKFGTRNGYFEWENLHLWTLWIRKLRLWVGKPWKTPRFWTPNIPSGDGIRDGTKKKVAQDRGDRSVDVPLRLSMFVQCQSGILCGRLTMINHG